MARVTNNDSLALSVYSLKYQEILAEQYYLSKHSVMEAERDVRWAEEAVTKAEKAVAEAEKAVAEAEKATSDWYGNHEMVEDCRKTQIDSEENLAVHKDNLNSKEEMLKSKKKALESKKKEMESKKKEMDSKKEKMDLYKKKMTSTTTLYVGNLSFYTTEEQIMALFSRAGDVKRIIMGLDKNKRTPCGFCFVEYYERGDAESCLRYINGTRLDDRIIRTDWDSGFVEGRQYGFGKYGGQKRDQKRENFDSERGGYGQIVIQMAAKSESNHLGAQNN